MSSPRLAGGGWEGALNSLLPAALTYLPPRAGEDRPPLVVAVDEADDRGLAGTQRAPAEDVPAGEVHLGHGPRPVAVHRLDVGDVSPPALSGDHDGAHHGRLALGVAVGRGVRPPLDRVAEPGDVAPVGDVPGAVPVGEVVGTWWVDDGA